MIVYAKVECHGEIHELRRNIDGAWSGGCGDMLYDLVYLADLSGIREVGCQGVVRCVGHFVGTTFAGTGVLTSEGGTQFWYQDGKLHRDDGPAVMWSDGALEWYLNDQRHRDDGPAVIQADGVREWYVFGERHRIGGPAIEGRAPASINRIWWIGGQLLSKDKYDQIVESWDAFVGSFSHMDSK